MTKPILVTGAHRSGTTWVGKMITNSPSVHYIHEPFNIDYSPLKVKPGYWFQYITGENESFIHEQIEQLLTPKAAPQKSKGGKQWTKFLNPGVEKQRILIKDPIAIFSVEWLASRFDMDVVIMIRHPAAFVESIIEQNWTHDFSHFLNQPLLMKEHLFPFEAEIKTFAKTKCDIIDQAILLWKLIYYMVNKYRQKHKDWLYIKHEELSAEPLKGFKKIFRFINVKCPGEIKKIILEHSSSINPVDGDVHSIKRDSKSTIKKWKNKFTQEEIKKIREGVDDISKDFYTDEDW